MAVVRLRSKAGGEYRDVIKEQDCEYRDVTQQGDGAYRDVTWQGGWWVS